jgi:hypothetical protein
LISFTVREYGTGPGTFVKRSGQPGLAILSTEWEQYESLDPHRGSGTYLVGRWFRYAKGRLQPEPGILARRLLNSFVDERSNDVEHQPYSYFANTKGRVLARDPSLGEGVALETLSGILERVTADDHGGADFELRLDDGRRITASFLNQSSHQPRERIDNVALAKLNRVLPQGVLPMAVVGDVTGRHVRLERYKDGKRENRVLWIE